MRWKKRKEAPPRLFQQEASQFSRVPSVVFGAAQPSPMPAGAFMNAASPGYSHVYYVPGPSQTPVVGCQPGYVPQPPQAHVPQPTQNGLGGADSPSRLEELETIQERLKELIAQEKQSQSSGSASPNGTLPSGKQPRGCPRRQDQGKEKKPASTTHNTAGHSSKSTSNGTRLHVCSDCDALRSDLFYKLHGATERRNFCTDCQVKRLEKHKLNPSLPIDHFCFQCGQARTGEFLKANPEAKKRVLANLCEECLLYSKSRQHVPDSSIVGDYGNDLEVCIPPLHHFATTKTKTDRSNSRLRPPPWALSSTSAAELALKPSWTTGSTLTLPSLAAGRSRFTRDSLATPMPKSRAGPVVTMSQVLTGFDLGTVALIKLQMMERAVMNLSRAAIPRGFARMAPLVVGATEVTPRPGSHPQNVEPERPNLVEMHRLRERSTEPGVGRREG